MMDNGARSDFNGWGFFDTDEPRTAIHEIPRQLGLSDPDLQETAFLDGIPPTTSETIVISPEMVSRSG